MRLRFPSRLGRAAGVVVASFAIVGCADLGTRFIQPYRVEIQQGNFVSAEQVAALRKDMSREQVRFVLGTPMLQDVFHTSRWDYPFYIRRTSGEILERKLVVFFENDKLARWDADQMPYERPQQDGQGTTRYNPADVNPDPPSSRRDAKKPGG